MRAVVYREYITHPSIPGGEATVLMPSGKKMVLRGQDGWRHEFRNRAACVKWLRANMPDALIWAFNDGVTVCGGSFAS